MGAVVSGCPRVLCDCLLRFAVFREGWWILGCPHGRETQYFTVFSVHFLEGPAEDDPQTASKQPPNHLGSGAGKNHISAKKCVFVEAKRSPRKVENPCLLEGMFRYLLICDLVTNLSERFAIAKISDTPLGQGPGRIQPLRAFRRTYSQAM